MGEPGSAAGMTHRSDLRERMTMSKCVRVCVRACVFTSVPMVPGFMCYLGSEGQQKMSRPSPASALCHLQPENKPDV